MEQDFCLILLVIVCAIIVLFGVAIWLVDLSRKVGDDISRRKRLKYCRLPDPVIKYAINSNY